MKRRQVVKIDYEFHATRHMCEGCNKVHGGGRTLLGYVCTTFRTKPHHYVGAGECPMNIRLRPPVGRKVHVGQGKTKAGGNR
jgi:hypothetical protein